MVERLTAVAAEAVGGCVLVELVAGRMPGNTVVGVLAAVSAPDTVGPAVVWARACGAAEIPEMATTRGA